MKKILILALFSFWMTGLLVQTFITPVEVQVFDIVGKGKSDVTQCSGRIWKYIEESGISFAIQLSDMSDDEDFEYETSTKKQIDKNTIRYNISGGLNLKQEDCYIIEQKHSTEKNVYFFEFPPLHPSQGRTKYKTVKKELF